MEGEEEKCNVEFKEDRKSSDDRESTAVVLMDAAKKVIGVKRKRIRRQGNKAKK